MATEVRQEHPDEDDANENAKDPTIPTSVENNNNNENSCGQEIHAQAQTTIPSTLEPQINNDTTQNLQSNLEEPMETNVITVKAELLDETIPIEKEPQPQINNDKQQTNNENLQQTNSEIPMETSAVTVKEEPDPGNFENLGRTNDVEVKAEPDNFEIPIDENMPISKDSNYLSANSNGNPLQSSEIGNETTDAELDKEFQDGIATAVMPTKPRLRVKPELSFIQPTIGTQPTPTEAAKSSANSSEHLNKEELMLPPPPPTLASDANSSGLLADGVATPRISLLAVNRLGVKTEISCQSNESEVNDDNTLQSSEIGNKVTTDAELDKELQDGIATAVIPTKPRLRVKPELSFIQPTMGTQQTSTEAAKSSANSSEHLNNEELMLPPPPPALSSNSNSDLLADGIATPRISLIAVNRLRVKTEFSSQSNESDNEESRIPDEFFDDLLEAKSPKEVGEIRDSDNDLDSEDIPPDFFDDLLPAEALDQENVDEHEEKYSEKIKEKERLRNDNKTSKDKHKSHKKQKKTKRKTRKRSKSRSRSRSRSKSPKYYSRKRSREYRSISPDRFSLDNQRNRSSRRDASPASPGIDRKRSRLSPSRLDLPTTSRNCYRNEDFQTNYSLRPQENSIRVKQEIEMTTQAPPEEKALTPTQKRERAIKRATVLLNHLKNTSSGDNFINTTFQFASTVRKLPTSHSYVQQQIYENRSPLHTINNVSYKFNSHKTRFNLEEWGLASLPPNAVKVAKRVGCSAQFIYDKLKTITIPAKLKKIKNESLEQDNEEGEELIETNSSLFCNAMTQTDEDSEYHGLNKEKYNDIAIQAVPSFDSIGCQTLETQSPTKNTHDNDEAPIMKIIRDLNENQLMAIHSFAELIKEPPIAGATTAMEMYKIQTKIMDIYKISQIPSAVMPPQTQIVNNYTTAHRTAAHRQESYTQPVIQSVQSVDGTQFSIHDPRTRASAYNGRIISDASSAYNNSNGRYYGNSQSAPSSSTYRQNQPPAHNQASPPGSVKKYGRGALRRY